MSDKKLKCNSCNHINKKDNTHCEKCGKYLDQEKEEAGIPIVSQEKTQPIEYHYEKLSYIDRLYRTRINRRTFLLGFFIIFILYFVLMIAIGALIEITGISESGSLFLVVIPLFLLYIYSIIARRLHDIDISAWWMLIGLIPIVGLIMPIIYVFVGGTKGDNKWGKQPNPTFDIKAIIGLK